jgi:membrane protein required for colicin V production
MIIDLLLAILLLFALIKGYRRGLIVGIFSFVAVIVGLAAAMKLSTVVAGYINNKINVSDRWMPVISFLVVFIVAVILIRLGANLLQKTVEAAMLGWLNRLGGIIFYVALTILVYSVFLFYAEKLKLLGEKAIEESVSYRFVRPWGPLLIDGLGYLIPVFRDMFNELSTFFDEVAQDISRNK